MYMGRAEAVLAAAAARRQASAPAAAVCAKPCSTAMNSRAAEALLDMHPAAVPRDVRGAHATRLGAAGARRFRRSARATARSSLARGCHPRRSAVACLAEALAGPGDFEQARALLAAYPLDAGAEPAARAYLLAVRAELAERADAMDRAIADYRAALASSPATDSIRAALADALLARGDREEAQRVLDIERPSLALARAAASVGRAARSARACVARRPAGWRSKRARGDAAPSSRGRAAGAGRRRCRAGAGRRRSANFDHAEGACRRARAGARRRGGAAIRPRVAQLTRLARRPRDSATPSAKAFSPSRGAVRVAP